MKEQTYTVMHIGSGSTKSELSKHDVVDHIYCDDGQGYRLKPTVLLDLDGEVQESLNGFPDVLIWGVEFLRAGKWSSSQILAFGKTEDEANEEFLESAWNERRWNENKWSVMADEDYDIMISQGQ